MLRGRTTRGRRDSTRQEFFGADHRSDIRGSRDRLSGHTPQRSIRWILRFLSPCKSTSKLGNHSYEVWDTKLARRAKPYFVIQLCCYAEMLEAIQGFRPEFIR